MHGGKSCFSIVTRDETLIHCHMRIIREVFIGITCLLISNFNKDGSLRPCDIFHCCLQVCVIGSFCAICDISITGGVGGVYII